MSDWKDRDDIARGEANDAFLDVTRVTWSNGYRYHATVRADGCVHLWQRTKTDEATGAAGDYLHVCDLDDLIDALVSLRDRAVAKFGPSTWE